MGCWGPGLYQDDDAADLKSSVALLAKLPVDGDRLLEILLSKRSEAPDFDKDGGPAFWLVVADQFERRGIASARAFERALAAIDEGVDLRDLRARGMAEKDLRKRAKILAELRERFESPRALRPRPQAAKPPQCPVGVGDVLAFPTMAGAGINPWSRKGRLIDLKKNRAFVADGWGAMLILATGRAYDWFPWCAYASLSVSSASEPTLTAARESRLLVEKEARLGVPRPLHLKRINARALGRLPLDPGKVVARVPLGTPRYGPEFAVYADWSLYGYSRAEPFDKGVRVADLLAD